MVRERREKNRRRREKSRDRRCRPRPPRHVSFAQLIFSTTKKALDLFITKQTYGNTIDFQPGPALNVVIGPNGAGKSSLVCAICIGLGGAPSLLGEFSFVFYFSLLPFSSPLTLFLLLSPLPNFHPLHLKGRARDLSEYVRRGAQQGWVEITLASGSHRIRDTVIRRNLHSHDARSEWTVNGVPQARAADAAERVRELSIQLDNLCQFLPQDRVSEFARLTPSALLVETQRASGGGRELCDAHRKAAVASAASAAEDARAAALRGELAAASRQQEAVRGDAERLQQREEHTRRVQLARTKIKVLEARRADATVEETRSLIEAASRTIARNEAAAAAVVNAEELEALAEELSAASSKARRRVQGANAALRQQVGKLAEAAGRVDAVRIKLDAVPQEETARLRSLRAKEQHLQEAEAQLNAILLEGNRGGDSSVEESLSSSSKKHALEEAWLKVEALRKDLTAVRVAQDGKRSAYFQASADLTEARNALSKTKSQRDKAGGEKAHRARFLRVDKLLLEVERLRKTERVYKGPVFGPVGAEIQIKPSARDRAAARTGAAGRRRDENEDENEAASSAAAASVVARMLESAVHRSVMSQFVVTDTADQSRILELARETTVPAAVAQVQPGGLLPPRPSGASAPPARIKMTPELRELGVECVLGDIIDAPAEIKRVLEDEAGIDSRTVVSFLGRGRAPSLAAVRRVCPAVFALVTPEGVQRCLVSRYNKAAATTTIEPLRPRSELFEDSEGAAVKARAVQEAARAVAEAEQIKAELFAEVKELEAQENEVLRELRAASAEHRSLKSKRQTAEDNVKNAQIALVAERSKPSGEARAEELRGKFAALATEVQQQAARAARDAQELHALTGDAAATEALAEETAARSGALAAVTRIYRDQVKMARKAKREMERELVNEERAAAAARAAIGDFAPGGIRDPEDFDEETTAALEALPNDRNGLERVADDAEAAAAGISAADSDALRRFLERGAAVARLRAEADSAAAERAAAEAREAMDAWYPRARALIETVGREFTAAMRRLGCDGDATLVEADEGDDENATTAANQRPSSAAVTSTRRPPNPADASVRLRVRFREGEQLQTLDGSRQSGGERSVATILYLVAMQRVASAPFRVVDEINQGMDPNNERAVFGVLAEAAGAAGTPQCFLLTPKLLPDLPYSDSVTVLQVVNGPLASSAVAGPVTAARMLTGRGMLGGGGGGGGNRGGGGTAVPARG